MTPPKWRVKKVDEGFVAQKGQAKVHVAEIPDKQDGVPAQSWPGGPSSMHLSGGRLAAPPSPSLKTTAEILEDMRKNTGARTRRPPVPWGARKGQPNLVPYVPRFYTVEVFIGDVQVLKEGEHGMGEHRARGRLLDNDSELGQAILECRRESFPDGAIPVKP